MVFVIQLAKQVAQMDFIRKTILQKAFDLIDTNVSAFCLCSLGHTCTISLSFNAIYQDLFTVLLLILLFCFFVCTRVRAISTRNSAYHYLMS
jgi:hypothetical protein